MLVQLQSGAVTRREMGAVNHCHFNWRFWALRHYVPQISGKNNGILGAQGRAQPDRRNEKARRK
jgi:hypothetical protein